MTTMTKSFNNTNTKRSGDFIPEKNLWCREVYWKIVEDQLGFCPFKEMNGCHLRSCNRESHECRGAHNASELKPFKHIQEYNLINKSTYNWSQLFFDIISVIQKDGALMKSEEHLRILANLSTMNFFEVIRTWRDLACFYRKIAKELPSQKCAVGIAPSSSGFTYSEEVPKFFLSPNIEDIAWSFVRLTRWCPEHQKFKQAIETNQSITIWDMCLATGLNCKEGIHETNEKICEEDFLTSKCSCPTQEQIYAKQDEIEAKILDISNKILEIIKQEKIINEQLSSDGFVQTKSRKGKKADPKIEPKIDPKIELTQQMIQLKEELKNLLTSRLIHYSEFGMEPFEIQYQKWTEKKEAKARLVAENQAKVAENQAKVSNKESWEHGLVDNAKITKPVVKISKLGAKK